MHHLSRKRSRSSDLGLSMVEYALSVSVLGAVFLQCFTTLQHSGESAAERSISSVTSMTPCVLGPDGTPRGLLGDGAEECW